jgi:elongation factor G
MRVMETTVELRSPEDAEQLARALAQIASVDPTFGYAMDRESRAAIVMGTDEANLDAHLVALKRIYTGEVRVSAVRVRYREALAGTVDVDYTHKKQVGASGEFARVKLRIEPNEPSAGSTFTNEIVGGVVPNQYIGAVEQGVRSVCHSGVLAGFPLDARVSLHDGAFHEIDSSWIAFETAGRSAMQKGASQAGVMLLEPIMDIKVEMPAGLSSAVMADMDERRIGVIEVGGRIVDIRTIVSTGYAINVHAQAPLARLLGYAKALHAFSSGRASCAMSFNRSATE